MLLLVNYCVGTMVLLIQNDDGSILVQKGNDVLKRLVSAHAFELS